MTEIQFKANMDVQLIDHMGSDASIVRAMLVSTQGADSLDATESFGRINFLMKNRHGCYDSTTEVYTDEGWKSWPNVSGLEQFLTLNIADDAIEWQNATHLVRKPVVNEPMVHVSMAHVDLLVTADHNMVAKRRRHSTEEWSLVPAHDLQDASHRLRLGGGKWVGKPADEARMHLLGFFIGDGWSNGGTPEFHLRRERKIEYLSKWAKRAGFDLGWRGDKFYLHADDDFRLLVKKCYAWDGSKIIPDEILELDADACKALLCGLMNSDGSISPTGKETYSTTSVTLAGQVQIVALAAGHAATIADHPFHADDRRYGTKPRYRVTIYQERNMTPRVGWTTTARNREVTVEFYTGNIHCVTVPNGTLYVRRNGKALWCGNTPFEHAAMTFYIAAPIFVFREFHRHRIGWSYNEESGRYKQLDPVFYVPDMDRPLVQVGKPGAYEFVPGTEAQWWKMKVIHERQCIDAYAAYEALLNQGIAKEVARMTLPVNIYSSMYATCNPRSMMAFLSLRKKWDDAKFPSFPMREIEMVAESLAVYFEALFPLTYRAFIENGSVSP